MNRLLGRHAEAVVIDEMPWELNESPCQPIFNSGKLVVQTNPFSGEKAIGSPVGNVLKFVNCLSRVMDRFSLCSSCDDSLHVVF